MFPLALISGFLTWAIYRRAASMFDQNRASCVVSSIHAVAILVFASIAVLQDQTQLVDGLSTPLQSGILAASLGYYIVDSRISWQLGDFEGVLHHVICVFGQLASLASGRCGYSLMLNMLAGEISTPFLYVFKAEIFPKQSVANIAAQVLFAVLFLGARMVVAPFLARDLLASSQAPAPVKAACALLMALSTYWAACVVKEIIDFFLPRKHEQLIIMPDSRVSS